jgi:hypothetical protein
MKITSGHKMILSKNNSKSKIEISRHKDPIMDNILLINSLSGSKTYKNTWITEKDLPVWIEYLKNNGYTETKIIEDVESLEKNNKKKT